MAIGIAEIHKLRQTLHPKTTSKGTPMIFLCYDLLCSFSTPAGHHTPLIINHLPNQVLLALFFPQLKNDCPHRFCIHASLSATIGEILNDGIV